MTNRRVIGIEIWPHKDVPPGGCHPELQGYFASSRGDKRAVPTDYPAQRDHRFIAAWKKWFDSHVEFNKKKLRQRIADHLREMRIARLSIRLERADNPHYQLLAWKQMSREICARSDAQVARMEKRKGLSA